MTTAGIIWLAAAVGLAIGFGEFYLAGTFMVASLLIIFITPFINKISKSKKLNRVVLFVISREDINQKENILNSLRSIALIAEVKKITLKDEKIELSIEIVMSEGKLKAVEDFLIQNKYIKGFSY